MIFWSVISNVDSTSASGFAAGWRFLDAATRFSSSFTYSESSKGRVAEKGTYDELVAKNGLFCRILREKDV